MNDTIGIKVLPVNTSAKCISIFRNHSSLSIGEIKKLIEGENYVLSFHYTDKQGVKQIIECYQLLEKAGIQAKLFEHDRPATIDFFHNLSQLYGIIEKQVQEAYEAETANNEDDEG